MNRRRLAPIVTMSIGWSLLLWPLAHAQSSAEAEKSQALDDESDREMLSLLQQADAYRKADNCRDAVELYGRVIAQSPDLIAPYQSRAHCLANLGQIDAADRDYRILVERFPGDSDMLGALGWNLLLLGRIEEARKYTSSASQLNPLNRNWAVNLADIYLLLGDANTARRLYREALELIPGDNEFHTGPLADLNFFLKRGWSPRAVKATRGWIAAEYPKFAAHRKTMAALEHSEDLQAKQHYKAAEAALQSTIESFQHVFGPSHPATALGIASLASLYDDEDAYVKAEPLYRRALAITEEVLGPEHPDTATGLDNLALLYNEMGAYAKAEPLFQRALAIREKVLGPEHPDTARSLNNLAALYLHIGAYAKAEPFLQRALAITQKVLGPDDPSTTTTMNNLAALYDEMGAHAKAESLYQRALAIMERVLGAEHADTATSLDNVAVLYDKMGAYAKAEPLFQRALAIREKTLGPEHSATASSLDHLASHYDKMGAYAKAEPLFLRALAIREKILGPEHPDTATSLNDLALLYDDIGAYARAEPLFQRALAITEQRLGPDHPSTATTLDDLAGLYLSMGAYAKAEPLFQRALAIREKVLGPEHPDTARSLNNLAVLYDQMGAYTEAETLFQRALAITEEGFGPDHPSTATTLNNLAGLYVDMGTYAKAEPLYHRSLLIVSRGGDPLLLASVYQGLAALYAAERRPELAIFWGKQAVNTIQGVRAGLQSLNRNLQLSFLQHNRSPYKFLADRLIDQGRLPEAQQVLEMLKEQEYFDFVRADADAPSTSTHAGLTETEQSWQARYQASVDKNVVLSQELNQLQQNSAPSAAEKERIREIQTDIQVANAAFTTAIDEIEQSASNLQQAATRREQEHFAQLEKRNLDTSRLGLVNELDQKAGGGVVLLQYVVLEDGMRILMTTDVVQKAFRVPVGEKEIDHDVFDLQWALRHPDIDPRPAAKVLYQNLIAPLDADLEHAHTRTIMLSLDGTLRYVPFAALYDGQHYLVERYATSIFNEAVGDRILHNRLPTWRAAGLGRTEADPRGFGALPGVRQELEGIVHQRGKEGGIVDGVIYLDAAFTGEALSDALSSEYPVLHLASHFHFDPSGNEASSYLLLGDGTELTLSDLRTTYRLPKVDLLVLSACETAVGGGDGLQADGQEIEGMAADAQKIGAVSVLATLWSVSDASTAKTMEQFYRRHEQDKLSKAEALRQAQRAVMQDPGADENLGSRRGAERLPMDSGTDPEGRTRFKTDPNHPYAHPYYWAPFVLMGNWL